jgi:alanine dehydrogenase
MLSPGELEYIKPGSVICGFQHLAVMPVDLVKRLMALEATLIGYEIIRDAEGDLPILIPLSEMAGHMAVYIGSWYLQNMVGGRGVLIGNIPGVPPPTVVILGAGNVGLAAARFALSAGAHVIVLDADVTKLRRLSRELKGHIVTATASQERLHRYTAIADVVIGAVLIPGVRAPFLVTEEMVRQMKAGSVIVDVSIDQGGCVETSRPTTIDNPVYVTHGVLHYCVPNMTANVARTASRVLANATLPYLLALANKGVEGALREDPGLAEGVYLYRGTMVNRRVGETLGLRSSPLENLLPEGKTR